MGKAQRIRRQRTARASAQRQPTPTKDDPVFEYSGPPMTPWTVAYLWASMLTTLRGYHPDGGQDFADLPDPGDSHQRTILARAISVYAQRSGVTGTGPVSGPAVLNSLSLPLLGEKFLQPPVSLILFMKSELGHIPTSGEPGYQAYVELRELIEAGGVSAAEVLGDKGLRGLIEGRADDLTRDATRALGAVIHAIGCVTSEDPDPLPGDVAFSALSGFLATFLQSAPPPDLDSQFRRVLEQQVGWPDGKPPRSILDSQGPWFQVGFAPGLPQHGERARAWCRWLVQQGWAVEDSPGDSDRGVWMALPQEWASEVRYACGDDGSFGITSQIPWESSAHGQGDRPTEEFLRRHYGNPE